MSKSFLCRCRNWLGAGFDYRSAYRRADLAADWWSIVGPATCEEFEVLGRGKLQQLIDQGLTPDSRVLDVGCGTGQLTQALVGFLSPDGFCCGTDLAPEAVAFCRARYRLPNFVFFCNSMTRLPVAGPPFDAIYFGSVFTHLYPREIAALLVEARRLLAPTGFILADAFVAPTGSRWSGHRGMVVVREMLLSETFAAAGLHVATIRRWPWSDGIWRAIYRFTHRT